METRSFARQDELEAFFKKEEVTIAVTDSGLGGLSIVADAAERMRRHRNFSGVRLVFFNALFSEQGGYNSLESRSDKIRVFDSALLSLQRRFDPDLILIGCNTLSVLFPDTDFSRESGVPVRGIVDAGVEMIARGLREHPESRVVILGTQTTVEEGRHARLLVQKGFLPERIFHHACPDLIPYIERGFDSEDTEMLISAYVGEALQGLPDPEAPILVSLNCTHYAYSLELWRKAFLDQGARPAAILDPNTRMLDFLFSGETRGRFEEARVSVEAVSMVKIGRAELASIGSWLNGVSPQTARALADYEWEPELFEWKPHIKRE
jgi:glutamate racemase